MPGKQEHGDGCNHNVAPVVHRDIYMTLNLTDTELDTLAVLAFEQGTMAWDHVAQRITEGTHTHEDLAKAGTLARVDAIHQGDATVAARYAALAVKAGAL